MILVSSLKANIKHIGEKTIQRTAKSTQILSQKRKKKNFTSRAVWGRERWDMINENRRETTQVGEFEERNILSMKKDMTQVDDQKEDSEINPLSEE